MSNKFLDNPEQILIKKEYVSLQCIRQFYINVINYDFNAHFRDDGSGYVKTYSYFFACTKES